MRRLLTWAGATAVLVLAGVLMDARRAPRPVPDSMLQPVSRADDGVALSAAVLLQKRDCTGNLRVLELLHRADLPERLRLRVIWYVGQADDSIAIRRALPRWTRDTPLRRATRRTVDELAELGHRSTPVLVLYDIEGRVRLATQSPASSREFAGLRKAVEGLTWYEGL